MRERLARHLFPNVLDVDPGAAMVLRIDRAWSIADRQLTIAVGGVPVVLALDGSVADLRNALLARGVGISAIDHLGAPADALLDGAGGAGDPITIFSSPLWTMLDVYGSELGAAERNLDAALEQLFIDTADGEVLDVWGEAFGVLRLGGEDDPAYRDRIVREVFRPRNNRFAIEKAIRDLTGLVVTLNEPFRQIFQLSRSALSGRDHLQDGRFFTWNVFQPIYHSLLNEEQRQTVLAIIERNRPAGCAIVGERMQPPSGYAEGSFPQGAPLSHITVRFNLGRLDLRSGGLSSNLRLSNSSPRYGTRIRFTLFGNITRSGVTKVPLFRGTPIGWSGAWDDRTWREGAGLGLGSPAGWNTGTWDKRQWWTGTVYAGIRQTYFQLVRNSGFDGVAPWTDIPGAVDIANGRATWAGTDGGSIRQNMAVATVIGATYRFSLNRINLTGPGEALRVLVQNVGGRVTGIAPGNGPVEVVWTATRASTLLIISASDFSVAGSIDDVRLERIS